MLSVLDHLPEGLLDLPAHRLYERLDGPTLIHLPGRRQPSLFVSVLLHGHEITGWEAVRHLLARYAGKPLPRSLSLFIGNITAARYALRRLDNQPDYNRIWPGGQDTTNPEGRMMRQVVDEMAARGTFASVDVHNTSGLNPHYACANVIDHRFFQLATLFSRTVVYFTDPRGVASMAMGKICPAVTIECGQPTQRQGTEHALEYLNACLHLAEIPNHPVAHHDMGLFHTVATVKIPEQISFSFDNVETGAELHLANDIDRLNFRELPAGTILGWQQRPTGRLPLQVRNEAGEDVADFYFTNIKGEIRFARPVMPSMLTLDARIIRQDCLCYLMERYPLEEAGN